MGKANKDYKQIISQLESLKSHTMDMARGGDDSCFARSKPDRLVPEEILDKSFSYDFGDGWVANVSVEKMPYREAQKIIKKSKGFCGYDWMIDSIMLNGFIESPRKRE